jgi:hypothetical protein
MTATGVAVALLLLLWAGLLFVPLRWRPVGMYLFVFKVYAVALAPFIALVGVMLAVAGTLLGSWLIVLLAGTAAVAAFVAVVRIGSVRVDLTGAFGVGWEQRISAERRATMVRQFWSGRLPRSSEGTTRDPTGTRLPPDGFCACSARMPAACACSS